MKIEYAVMELHASVMILGDCVMKLGAFVIKLYQLRLTHRTYCHLDVITVIWT